MKLSRPDLDYQLRSREALIHVEEALRKNDIAVNIKFVMRNIQNSS